MYRCKKVQIPANPGKTPMESSSLKFVNCCLPKLLLFGYISAKILILKKVHHFNSLF